MSAAILQFVAPRVSQQLQVGDWVTTGDCRRARILNIFRNRAGIGWLAKIRFEDGGASAYRLEPLRDLKPEASHV